MASKRSVCKWLGPNIKCYYSGFPYNEQNCEFYKSFAFKGQCFDVGDFIIVDDVDGKEDCIASIVCLYESHEKCHRTAEYRGIVRWFIRVKDLDKTLFSNKIKFDYENEIVENCTYEDGNINLLLVKEKVRVVLATLKDPVYLISKWKLNPSLYFSCRYRLVDSKLEPLFPEIDDIKSPFRKNDTKQVILSDDTSDSDQNVTSPLAKNVVRRNLNKTFEIDDSDSDTPSILSYSVVDISSDSDTSVKIKLRKSKTQQKKTEKVKNGSPVVRRSKRAINRKSYVEILSPEKFINTPKKSSSKAKHCTIKDKKHLQEKERDSDEMSIDIRLLDPVIDLNDTDSDKTLDLNEPPNTPSKRLRRNTFQITPKHVNTSELQRTPKKIRLPEPGLEETSPKKSKISTPKTPKTPARRISVKSTPSSRMKLIKEGVIMPSVEKRDKIVRQANTPLAKAQNKLHVSYVPDALPCRENEYTDVYNFIESKLYDGFGGCMYISGVPGTGKTATVTSVIRKLQRLSEQGKVPEFDYVEINGMKLTEPRQSYVEILKQLTGKSATWEQAYNILETRFSKSKKATAPVVLLVDELDILCTKRQDVVYNLLDWPTKVSGKLIVVTIANTMDLPERLLMNRVTSRLGLTRLTFQAYTHKQLQEIVTKRLFGTNSFNTEAVQLVARKVASVSGDARRALDICRRAAEIAEAENKKAIVTIQHVNDALNAMITQPKIQAIKHCSKLEQLILQAIVAEVERTGVEETTFVDVYRMLRTIAAFHNFDMVTSTVALAALSRLNACRLILADQKCSDIHQKVILNISSDDVYYALKTD